MADYWKILLLVLVLVLVLVLEGRSYREVVESAGYSHRDVARVAREVR